MSTTPFATALRLQLYYIGSIRLQIDVVQPSRSEAWHGSENLQISTNSDPMYRHRPTISEPDQAISTFEPIAQMK